jgi:hypothetical protein
MRIGSAAPLALASALLAGWQPAAAQEVNLVPFASATAGWDSNRSLDRPPAPASNYGGNVGAEVRDLTPRSYTDLVVQGTYTDVSQLNYDWYTANAALNTEFHTVNGDYTLLAGYRRDDTFYTEFGHAEFNDLNPAAPDTSPTTSITKGITRQSYELNPGFAYTLTPRLELDGDFALNARKYSVETIGRYVDYTSPYAGLFLQWATGPRSSFGAGPYFAHYDQQDGGANTTNTEGAAFIYRYKSSDVTKMSLTLRVERDRINELDFGQESITAWGLEWVGTHKYRIGDVLFSIGRFLQPSSIGGRTSLDQFRAQFNRPLSARLSFTGALRITRASLIGNELTTDETPLDRANAEMYLRWDITRTWYVTGGYIFARSQDVGIQDLAFSNGVSLTFGYRGLEPARPADR